LVLEAEPSLSEPQDAKSLSRQRFGQFSQRYVTSSVHAAGEDLARLQTVAGPQPAWQVLDVATGGGHTARTLAPDVGNVVASDLTPRMLAAAGRHLAEQGVPNFRLCAADAEHLPFRAGVFDLVTCRIAPHHFPNPPRFVSEAARVLVSGGSLVVQDQVLPADALAARYVDAFEKLRDPSHNRAYSLEEWQAMFSAAGLIVEHAEEIVRRHDFASWTARQDNSPATVASLEALVQAAPPLAAGWLAASDFGTPQASFAIHYGLLRGRKA
jgi:ubiquinone/menaquinone biosynthesis C-methylase UbiE